MEELKPPIRELLCQICECEYQRWYVENDLMKIKDVKQFLSSSLREWGNHSSAKASSDMPEECDTSGKPCDCNPKIIKVKGK